MRYTTAFDANALYIVYWDGSREVCVWMIPGTWEDDD